MRLRHSSIMASACFSISSTVLQSQGGVEILLFIPTIVEQKEKTFFRRSLSYPALTIVYVPVPHFTHLPLTAIFPFFIVTSSSLFEVVLSLHFIQKITRPSSNGILILLNLIFDDSFRESCFLQFNTQRFEEFASIFGRIYTTCSHIHYGRIVWSVFRFGER